VLGDKRAGYEQARDASVSFRVNKGVLETKDFVTSSPSLILTGEGRADLASKQVDMTIRLNARGLLGLLTLPLKPINGLFQFRGTGELAKPTWRAAPFTVPGRGQADPIYGRAPRARVVPE
ncbi:MAG: AsmA-like C-terminal region-containing protein, partial [Verrucomicrobiales bacterium]